MANECTRIDILVVKRHITPAFINKMELSNDFEMYDKPTEQEFDQLVNLIKFPIDQAYLDFMKMHNGAEGTLSDGAYIALWPISDIVEINRQYSELYWWDHYFCFGSDGSDQTYAFDKRNGSIVFIDPYNLGEIEPENYGNSFIRFLEVLSKKQSD